MNQVAYKCTVHVHVLCRNKFIGEFRGKAYWYGLAAGASIVCESLLFREFNRNYSLWVSL